MQVQRLRRPGAYQQLTQPGQPLAGDATFPLRVESVHLQQRGDFLRRAGGSDGFAPAAALVVDHDGLDLARRRHLGRVQALLVDLAVGKKALAIADAAHEQRFHQRRLGALANDEFGRPATNIHHQATVIRRRQGICGTDEDQPRFLTAADDLDRKSQRCLSLQQHQWRVPCDPHGIGRHRPHGVRRKTAQAFAEAAQRGDRALLRSMIEQLLAGETGTQANRLAQGIQRVNLFANDAPDLDSEAVGTQVHTGYQFVTHGCSSSPARQVLCPGPAF
ncbi:MAG: hypothetical protein AW08_00170 [Candidatus Accumulibacter adjunctus]|uniref:Uncharacterized protein n=1 Tax=Candidatus Accumulibacter adjunctus TaxID=1454001 RepID=A0A011NYF2_9PROT|nr:MAG: hypothetical protein AW08_00170 [Candidatus Accumulibacter adjunctus]